MVFDGDDPRAFILAMNIKRRHMTKGQQVMAEPEKEARVNVPGFRKV